MAFLAVLFGRALRFTRKLLKAHFNKPYVTVIVSSLVIVCLVYAFGLYDFEGSGMNLLKHALAGSIGTYDFAIKAGLVFMALAFGLKGGEIMPTLAIGGLTGCSVGQLIGIDARPSQARWVSSPFMWACHAVPSPAFSSVARFSAGA